jgi:hypothetical protein
MPRHAEHGPASATANQSSALTTPTGQDTPVPLMPQYPFGFYCLKDTAGAAVQVAVG